MRSSTLLVVFLVACGDPDAAGPALDGATPGAPDAVRPDARPEVPPALDAPARGGGATTIARDQPQPRSLAVHDGFVYFARYRRADDGGAIARVAVTGGEVEVLATAQSFPAELVVDDGGVYWITAGEPTHPACVMAQAHGGAATCLEARPSANAPSAIALDGDVLVWTETLGGDVRAIARTGGASAPVTTRQVHPAGLTTAGASVVWVNDDPPSMFGRGGLVRAAPLAGGEPVTLAEGQRHPYRIVTDGATAYWTSSGSWGAGDGEVVAVSLAGGAPVALASGLAFPAGLALDGGSIYVACAGDGTVRRIPAAGGAATVLATGVGSPHGVAVDASFVYYADEEGTIGRIPR